MADLTDEQLESMVRVGDRGTLMAQAATELQRHRSVVAANKEQIQTTVATEILALLATDGPVTTEEEVNYVASRIAGLLTVPLDSLTLDEHDHARALILHLTDMRRDAQLRGEHDALVRVRNMYGVFTKLLRLCGIIQ